MKSIPDYDYNTYSVSMEELKNHLYKARVSKENRNHDYRKFAANKLECDIVIRQNIVKANYIIRAEKTADNELPQAIDILKVQLKNMKDNGYIAVLSTCVFYIFDYNPKLLMVNFLYNKRHLDFSRCLLFALLKYNHYSINRKT